MSPWYTYHPEEDVDYCYFVSDAFLGPARNSTDNRGAAHMSNNHTVASFAGTDNIKKFHLFYFEK